MPRILIPTIKPRVAGFDNLGLLLTPVLLGLSVPGIGAWPLAWCGLVPALIGLAKRPRYRDVFRQGLGWGMLYNAVVFGWFWGMAPLDWMGLPGIAGIAVITGAWFLAALTQGFIIALLWLGLYRLYRWHLAWLLAIGPFLWAIGFALLNQTPLGVPWGFLAYSQAGFAPLRNLAHPLTFWGLEAAIILVNLLIWQAWIRRNLWVRLSPVALMFALLCLSTWDAGQPRKMTHLPPLTAIQGNLTIDQERGSVDSAWKTQYYQTLLDKAPRGSRLLILPEGVISLASGNTANPFRLAPGQDLLTGGVFERENPGAPRAIYNGAVLFSAGRPFQPVGKRVLVPFGETTPIIPEDWVIHVTNALGIDYGKGFAIGKPDQPLPVTSQGQRVGAFICFEALYPGLARRFRLENADFLVTFGNLGWFHGHPWLEREFLAINQFRAVETGLPLVLATNTGISAIVAADGNVIARTRTGHAERLVWAKPKVH